MELYHWTTEKKAKSALANNRLTQRRWVHYLEQEDRFAHGTSWSHDGDLWNKKDESCQVCFIINTDNLPNNIFPMNGSRNFWLTKSLLGDSNYDPDAWKLESQEITEHFIEGTILNLKSHLIDIVLSNTAQNEDLESLSQETNRPKF